MVDLLTGVDLRQSPVDTYPRIGLLRILLHDSRCRILGARVIILFSAI